MGIRSKVSDPNIYMATPAMRSERLSCCAGSSGLASCVTLVFGVHTFRHSDHCKQAQPDELHQGTRLFKASSSKSWIYMEAAVKLSPPYIARSLFSKLMQIVFG